MEKTENREIIQRPRICAIDLKVEDSIFLKSQGHNVTDGSFGSVMEIPISNHNSSMPILLDYYWPENFHEYDILIVDLTNEVSKTYVAKEHSVIKSKNSVVNQLICRYPMNIFDPRPYASFQLVESISEIGKRKFIQIVFACGDYHLEYESIKHTSEHYSESPKYTHGIYDFLGDLPLNTIKLGTEIVIPDSGIWLKNLFGSYKDNLSYQQTFKHPAIWDREKQDWVDNPDFFPLMLNGNNEIISYIYMNDQMTTLIFPDIKKKADFINELLTNYLPSLIPEVFPFSTEFAWKSEPEYFLPNEIELNSKKEKIRDEYKGKLNAVENEILVNRANYKFLHDLLTETDNALVKAIKIFLEWLGFENIIIPDESGLSILEEDLQVPLSNGLLVIEAKGIGGTSTDSECSQISKIKHRREKQRKAFDVFALYIVNHQRFMPPIKRKNPPFSEHQISDALNDERGLVTTWQLYNLYLEIQAGLISKEEARLKLIEFGLVEFKPALKDSLGEIKHIYKNGTVAIVELTIKIDVGQTLLGQKNDRFFKTTVQSIQLDGEDIPEADNIEVGIMLDVPVTINTKLWTF